MSSVLLNGREVNYEVCVNLMDDEIREELHRKMAPCGDQEFLDAYCKAHKEKYGKEFTI